MIKYISILPVLIYIVIIWHNYGVQKSISESYYRLKRKRKPFFYLSLTTTCILMILGYAIENTEPLPIITLFLAGSAICFTAAACDFKESKLTKLVHIYGAAIGYIFGYLFIIIDHGWDSIYFVIPSAILAFIVARIEDNKQKRQSSYKVSAEFKELLKYESKFVWWAEIIGLITIYLATL